MKEAVLWRLALRVSVLAAVAISLCLGVSLGWAGGDEEEYLIQHSERRHFVQPIDARSAGMGGAYVASWGDASGVYGNPAGLGALERLQLRVSYFYDQLSGDLPTGQPNPPVRPGVEEPIHGPSFLAAVPNPYFKGVLGLGYNGTWAETKKNGKTESEQDAYTLSYGLPLGEQWAVGYGFSYFGQKQDRKTQLPLNQVGGSESADLFSHRFGVMYRPIDPVTLGAMLTYGHGNSDRSLQDGGPDWDGNHKYVSGRVGASWQVLEKTLVAADVEVSSVQVDSYRHIPTSIDVGEEGDLFGLGLGVEQEVTDWLCGRVGYRYHSDDYDFHSAPDMSDKLRYHAVSCGAGLKFDQFTLDYGLEYRAIGDGDFLNVLSTGWKF